MRVKKVILYEPELEEDKEHLKIEVAKVHGKAVINRIRNLSCPPLQKKELYKYIIQSQKQLL